MEGIEVIADQEILEGLDLDSILYKRTEGGGRVP